MRFSRDKRGYENTFVVHAGSGRRRGKARSRILYWFRTPPGVRVGRSALDEDAIRLIEEHNPDVEFDWTRILKEGGGTPPAPVQQERRARPRPPRESIASPAVVAAVRSPAHVEEPVEQLLEPVEDETQEISSPETRAPSSAAEARLGPEGLSRLRARHAEVLARISEGISDPVRRDELKAQAERLNPDTWVTDAEVTAGLESYEAVFESLRTVVGRRRKRRRSRKPRPEEPSSPAGSDRPDDDGTDPEFG